MHRFLRVFLLMAFAACGNRAASEPTEETGDRPVSEVVRRKVARDSVPREIYYNLTAYPWYARAEPLVFDDAQFFPHGKLVAIPLAKLHRAGNYQGVDFYVLRSDEARADVLYVPVFEGYWLPFVLRQ